MSLKELIKYYSSINLADYSSIGIDLPINLFLLAFLIGMLLTIIVVNLIRETNTNIIRKLMRYEAFDECTSKTLDEIKLNTFLAKITLKSNGMMKKVIKRVGEKEYTFEEYNEAIKSKNFKEEKIDFATAKFYICESTTTEAQRIAETKNSSLFNTILLCVLLTIIVVSLIICMPEILYFINQALAK